MIENWIFLNSWIHFYESLTVLSQNFVLRIEINSFEEEFCSKEKNLNSIFYLNFYELDFFVKL